MARKKIQYTIWYKAKGTCPPWPNSWTGIGKKACDEHMKLILADGRFEIITVTEETVRCK